MLDNLQFILPFTVDNPTGTGSSIPMPSSLWHICQGRSIWIGPSGNLVIGKFNLNSNGTKLLCGEIGKTFKTRSKNQNYFQDEDVPSIKEFLKLPQGEPLPGDLYQSQLNILFDRLDEVRELLSREGFKVSWKPGHGGRLNRIKRLEICQDFLVSTHSRELIKQIDSAVSECGGGEPLRSDVVRSKKFSRQCPFHSWDINLSNTQLKGGKFQIKLYQKDLFVRLELVCLNVPIQNMLVDSEPFSWLRNEFLRVADEAAIYLGAISNSLREELKINDFDRAAFVEGLKLYSSTLKYTDEAVRTFVDSIMDRQVYTPTAHRGLRIGRKSLENLSDTAYGMLLKLVNPVDKSNFFSLREDWRLQLHKKNCLN